MIKRIDIPPYDSYDLSAFVVTGDLVHIGHFGGYCDAKGNLLTTIEEQMDQTLSNLERALGKIDLTLDDVVNLTVLLKNTDDFQGMHSVWKKRFKEGHYPVRSGLFTDFVSEDCLVQVFGFASY